MKVPVINKSLCGCTLRTGSLCAAYTYLVISLLFSGFYLFLTFTTKWRIVYAYDLCVGFQLAATIYLLVGIYKKNRKFMAIWMIISVIIGVIILSEAIDVYLYTLFDFSLFALALSFAATLFLCLKVYMILIVYNYRREIAENYEKHVEYSSDAGSVIC